MAGLVLTHGAGRIHPSAAIHRAPNQPPATPLRPRSRVSVLVLNGNGTSGVAGSTATRLLGRGYHSATATNAAVGNYATPLGLHRPGWAPQARPRAHDP